MNASHRLCRWARQMASALLRSCSAIATAIAAVFRRKYSPGEQQQPGKDDLDAEWPAIERLQS